MRVTRLGVLGAVDRRCVVCHASCVAYRVSYAERARQIIVKQDEYRASYAVLGPRTMTRGPCMVDPGTVHN